MCIEKGGLYIYQKASHTFINPLKNRGHPTIRVIKEYISSKKSEICDIELIESRRLLACSDGNAHLALFDDLDFPVFASVSSSFDIYVCDCRPIVIMIHDLTRMKYCKMLVTRIT